MAAFLQRAINKKQNLSEKLARTWYKLVRSRERARALKNIENKQPLIVGVTGSCGKSTTVMMLNQLLEETFGQDVALGYSNNTERSVYRTFRKLQRKSQTVIQEISAGGGAGYLDYLVKDIPIDIAILTAIGTDHVKAFPSFDHIVQEKEKILHALVPSGVACLNIDDENISKIAKRARKDIKLLTVSCKQEADLRATIRTADWKNGLAFDLEIAEQTHFVQTKFVGTLALTNILLALAAIHAAGHDVARAIKALAQIEPIDNRGNVIAASNGQFFLLDAYKAPLWSTLDFINDLPNIKSGPMVMVLGQLSDTGNSGEGKHRRALKNALQHVDVLIGIGSSYSSAKKLKAANPDKNIMACETIDDVATALEMYQDHLVVLKSARYAKLWRIFEMKNGPISCKILPCSLDIECKSCALLRA